MTFKTITEIDWQRISAGFSPGATCIVATNDSEMIRYQIATFDVGKGWRNQFGGRVYNITHWAYITPTIKEKTGQ